MNKSKILSEKNITRLMLVIFIIQVIFIVWLNLFKGDDFIEHDASMLYSHTIHMWEQKKLVIPNYQEETFFHLDTSCIIALPLYGLTHNIILAYGISNIIFLTLTLYIMNDLLKRLNLRDVYRYAGLLLYIIPYRLGLAQYLNMLFFECSFYNVCIIVTILAIDLLLYKKPENPDKKEKYRYYAFLAIYALLNILTAFSRGTYTMLVALLPAIFCYALEVILSKEGFAHIEKSKIVVVIVTFVSYAVGMGYAAIRGLVPNTTGYRLIYPRDLVDNFFDVIWGHFCIFVGLNNPEVFTKDGIIQLGLLAYAFLIIVLLIFNLKHAFKEEPYSNALRYLTLIYLWNATILGLTDCSNSEWGFPERYLFPGFVPLLLSMPIMLTYMEKIKKDLLRQTLYLVVSALTLITLVFCNYKVLEVIWKTTTDLQGIKEVLAYARSEGIDTVFFVNDDNAALISRSLDPTIHVAPVDKRDDGSLFIHTREDYASARDRGSYSDENILAMTWYEKPEDVFKDYQFSSYQYVCDVKDYHLYHAGSNKFDDMYGFPLDDHHLYKTTDFCHTPGYTAVGEIDLYGYLEATGSDNYVLLSPYLEGPYAKCNVTLKYEIGHKTAMADGAEPDESTAAATGSEEDKNESAESAAAATGSETADGAVPSTGTVGKFVLLDDKNQEIKSVDIKGDEESAVLSVDPGQSCYVAVWLNSGEKITLSQIDFEIGR
ncbi:MAG: hypothetical protein K6E98_01900 [Lachnospiraceae bacterium]|nr:hypothetical protein [Lachnospiraceae bacterium]